MGQGIKTFLIFSLQFVLLFLFSKPIFAVAITISNFPATIDSENSYSVTASISGAVNATNYLRADLFKEGTTNYFGETYNGSDWYSGGEGKSYFPIQVQNSSASATFYFQLGNPSGISYSGPGSYKLKIRRYTSSGSASSNDIQTPVDIQITYVFPTPTLEPTPTPNPSTPTPASTPPPKTPTPVPIATPIKTNTPRPTPTATPEVYETSTPQVLAISDISESVFPSPISETTENKSKLPYLGFVFVFMGILFIGFSISSIIKGAKNSQIN